MGSFLTRRNHQIEKLLFKNVVLISNNTRGAGTGGAGGAIAPPIFLEVGNIFAFSTPNISRSK